jgi:hypothetical protein
MVSNLAADSCYNWKHAVQEECLENREQFHRLGHPLLLILARIYFAENVFASWFRAEDNLYLFLDYATEGIIKKEYCCFVKQFKWKY